MVANGRTTPGGGLLPERVTNEYFGARIALYFFCALTALTLVRSVLHIVLPDGGARSIATIPLDTFTANGTDAVIHLFALWGLSQLVIGILYVIVLVRYRSLIPLCYLLAIAEYGVRLLLTFAKPFDVAGTAPGAVGNYVLIPILAFMYRLSLTSARPAGASG